MIRILSGILLVSMLLTACTADIEPVDVKISGETMTVFLKSGSADSLVPLTVKKVDGETISKIEYVLGMLRSGIDNTGTQPTIGDAVVIQRMLLDNNGNVSIHFTSDYSSQSILDEMVCRASIVRSISNLEEIESVTFFIDGMPLRTAGGTLIGKMSGSNIVLDFNELVSQNRSRMMTLYYPSSSGVGLTRVVQDVSVKHNETMEEAIIDMLMKPPADIDVVTFIPATTVIKSVVTANGICYVDVGSEFRTDHAGGSYAEKMTVYSIVNSLTELSSVQRVQFMVDGHIVKRFKGSVDFGQLFVRNLNYVTKW